MGSVPISELDILAWQVNRRLFLQPWEIQFLRKLSAAFVATHQDAGDRDFPAPYRARLGKREAAAVTKSLMADFRGAAS